MNRLLFALITMLALSNCKRAIDPPIEESASSEETAADIRYALAKYIFENNASGRQQNVDFYFLKINEEDPSADFIARFQGQKPEVLPASLAKVIRGKGVLHKEDKGKGLISSMNEVEWVSDTEVKVPWGYFEASLSASSNTATLKFDQNTWTVTSDRVHVMA